MQDIDNESLAFSQHSQTQASLSKLYLPALHSIKCAAVERVFSHRGGRVIMRPHRACMSDKLLSQLIVLEGNSSG